MFLDTFLFPIVGFKVFAVSAGHTYNHLCQQSSHKGMLRHRNSKYSLDYQIDKNYFQDSMRNVDDKNFVLLLTSCGLCFLLGIESVLLDLVES